MQVNKISGDIPLVVLHQNIQSVRNKTLDLELFINTMDEKPNILCLSEHWLRYEEEEYVKVEGYSMITCLSRRTATHGGVCILSDNTYAFEEVAWVKERSIECQIECVCAHNKQLRVVVLCIYRTNLGNFNIFIERAAEILDELVSKFRNNKFIVSGDFNVNLLEKSNQTQTFLDQFNSYNLNQTVFQPTRVTKNTSSLLDNIFVNFDTFEYSKVVVSALSDHHAQVLCIEKTPKNMKQNPTTTKIFFSTDRLAQFRQLILETDWNIIYMQNDADTAYNIFIDKINQTYRLIFIPKRVQVTKTSHQWITKGIKVSCATKRFLYKQKLTGRVTDVFYNNYKNILKKVILKAKQLSNSNYIINSENKTKATWSLIKKITNNSIKQTLTTENFSSTNLGPNAILNMINSSFINSCPDVNNNLVCDYTNIKANTESLFLYPTDTKEILNCINTLKNKKSVGEDQIPINVLKEVADLISHPLCHIINLCFLTGVFPQKLKIAHIKPIHKKGAKDDTANYRPISLLSNVSKIFEKIIYNRLIKFLDKGNVVSDSQNGFRKKKSTISAIYQAMVKITDSLNNKKSTAALCLDLSKAFDSVDHIILCKKLELYGIRGVPQNLLKSYLSDRIQYVIETDANGNTLKSDGLQIKKGVPQGSILGPLLYILYTNELPSTITNDTILYADDTSVIFSEDKNDILKNNISDTMGILETWFSSNNLRLNISKTQLIHFRDRNKHALTVDFKNAELKPVENISFLGVNMDSRLDWAVHVDTLAKELSKYCFALRTLSYQVSMEAAISAYHAYVQSKIRYGVIFWGNSVQAQRILTLQKKCLRSIFHMKQTETCKPIYIKYRILTLISLYIYESIIFVSENKSLFTDCERGHSYSTRNKNNLLSIQRPNFNYVQKSAHHSVIKMFNKVPVHIRELPLQKLKLKLKTHLLATPYYTLNEFFNDHTIMNM